MTQIKIKLEDYAFLPSKAHKNDAAYDLKSPINFSIEAFGDAIIDTGVHMEIPYGYFGSVTSKSGLYFKHGITTDGVVDSGYTGTIHVKLCNHSNRGKTFAKGDKIAQIIIQPLLLTELVIAEEIELSTERGNNGFGSSGR